MKITFVNMYYPPHLAQTGMLLRQLAVQMAGRGHDVGVLCSNADYAEDRLNELKASHGLADDPILVHRIWCFGGRKSKFTRCFDYLLFYFGLALRLLRMTDTEAIVCFTSPPMVDIVALMHKRLYGSKLVLVALDNYPDALARAGTLSRKSILYRLLAWVRSVSGRNTELSFAPDMEMASLLTEQGFATPRVLRYWEDAKIYPRVSESQIVNFREAAGWSGKFVALYLGNLGIPHDFLTFVDAAARLDRGGRVLFAFIGGGSSWRDVEKASRDRGLSNLTVSQHIDKAQVNIALRSAQVALISLLPEMVGIGSPFKLVSALRCGKPILYVGTEDSEVGRAAESCGKVVGVGDSAGAASFVDLLSRDIGLLNRLGRQAVSYGEATYDTAASLSMFAEMTEMLARDTPMANPGTDH